MKALQRSALFFLFAIFLAILAITTPASAGGDAPAFGCNSSGCSIWVFSYAWPDEIEVNAFDFVRVSVDVNTTDTKISASLNYLGVLCRIPKLADSPVCPDPPDEPLGDNPTIAVDLESDVPSSRLWTAEALQALWLHETLPLCLIECRFSPVVLVST